MPTIFLQALRNRAYSEKGWIHKGLVELCANFGVSGKPIDINHIKLDEHLERGGLVIASVRLRFPIEGGRGGHLILIKGISYANGRKYIFFNDPSRWGETHGCISEERFLGNLGNRCIVISGKIPQPVTPILRLN